jgi:hypothetical protein
LNLDEKIPFAKDFAQPVGIFFRLLVFLFHHRFGHRPAQASGKGNQAFAMFREQVVVDARFVIKAFEKARGNQLDQVVITLKRFAQQHQVIRPARPWLRFAALLPIQAVCFFSALVPAALGDIHFAANDGLDVALTRFVKEIRCREKIPVIGDRHRRHFLPRSFVQQFRCFAGPIQQAVIGVNVQVNKLRLTHGPQF